MANYRIRYWRDIPSLISAQDEHGRSKQMLPQRFQDAIDRAAMVAGETSEDAYLDGWTWGPMRQMRGPADRVARMVALQIDSEYPTERLDEMIRAHRPGTATLPEAGSDL